MFALFNGYKKRRILRVRGVRRQRSPGRGASTESLFIYKDKRCDVTFFGLLSCGKRVE